MNLTTLSLSIHTTDSCLFFYLKVSLRIDIADTRGRDLVFLIEFLSSRSTFYVPPTTPNTGKCFITIIQSDPMAVTAAHKGGGISKFETCKINYGPKDRKENKYISEWYGLESIRGEIETASFVLWPRDKIIHKFI